MARPQRVQALDVTRGIAMVLVCIAHFFDMYDQQGVLENSWLSIISLVCRVATPTFILVSGMVLGYQVAIKGVMSPVLRMHLVDRALFLAIVGHLLIAMACAAQWGIGRALSVGYITDTITFCVLGGLVIIPATRDSVRGMLGGLILFGSWFGWQCWFPQDPELLLARAVFLGPTAGYDPVFFFPLLPWFGWYLIGSCIGGVMSRDFIRSEFRISTRLICVALGMMIGAILIKWWLAPYLLLTVPSWQPLLSLYQKSPPGPVYLLLMGGAAMLLVSVTLSIGDARWMGGVRKLVVPIGQNSLAVFIVQFFVYYSFLYLVFLKNPSMPVVLVGALLFISLAGILIFAIFCRRYHVSRWLTIGVTELDSHLKVASMNAFPDPHLVSPRQPVGHVIAKK